MRIWLRLLLRKQLVPVVLKSLHLLQLLKKQLLKLLLQKLLLQRKPLKLSNSVKHYMIKTGIFKGSGFFIA